MVLKESFQTHCRETVVFLNARNSILKSSVHKLKFHKVPKVGSHADVGDQSEYLIGCFVRSSRE